MKENLIYPDLIRYFIYYAQGLNYESMIKSLNVAICESFEISTEDLYQHCRKRTVIDARRSYFYILKEALNIGPPEIAKRTGFDRTTVLYHNKKIPDLIETEKKYREKVESIIRGIKNHNIILT